MWVTFSWKLSKVDKEKEEEEEEDDGVVEREELKLLPPFETVFLSSILYLEENETSEKISEIWFLFKFSPCFNPWEAEDDKDDEDL